MEKYPPVRLDLENEWVWCGEKLLQLTPKAFAVLHYLMAHPGRLVTKEELLRAVWPDTVVSQWALTTCIREIRRVVGDKAQVPQYIETVHRRGYRFIGQVRGDRGEVIGDSLPSSSLAPKVSSLPLVGREAELGQLQGWLKRALGRERQVVFVTGEAGVGKTALVEAFLQQAAADKGVWVGWGQCIEHYGAGEAYLPVLEALGRLGREGGHERFLEVLRERAPTWLVQMPALVSAAELEALQHKVQGTTRERMLRQ